MKRVVFFQVFAITAVTLTLLATPQTSSAQRGGFHGGGGARGFHGGFRGGGFSGFRGGHSFGDFRSGFGGFRGGRGFYGRGFYGRSFYGGFRGYRGFYPGFYSGFGFGFWPYWGAYPYGYGYGWWAPGPYAYYSPYDYPDEGYGQRDGCRADDPCDRDGRGRDHRDCYDYRQKCSAPDSRPDNRPDSRPDGGNAPAKPSSEAAPDGARGGNYLTVSLLNSAGSGNAAIEHVGSANTNSLEIRPAVRNAIAVLRAMPPAARERQLKSGRYDAFSSEERKFVARAAQSVPLETTN
jgi:hypothetical protein